MNKQKGSGTGALSLSTMPITRFGWYWVGEHKDPEGWPGPSYRQQSYWRSLYAELNGRVCSVSAHQTWALSELDAIVGEQWGWGSVGDSVVVLASWKASTDERVFDPWTLHQLTMVGEWQPIPVWTLKEQAMRTLVVLTPAPAAIESGNTPESVCLYAVLTRASDTHVHLQLLPAESMEGAPVVDMSHWRVRQDVYSFDSIFSRKGQPNGTFAYGFVEIDIKTQRVIDLVLGDVRPSTEPLNQDALGLLLYSQGDHWGESVVVTCAVSNTHVYVGRWIR